jgi:NAD(P)-dependent dehydrogenase (short-subunit alcohol dehydrogenase family)
VTTRSAGGTTVLLTGASSGIGAATALALDRAGITVFAGVRDPADAAPLDRQSSDRLTLLRLDITDQKSIAAAVTTLEEQLGGGGLDAVVNNAGEGIPGPLEILPLNQLREQFEVNVIGQVAVTQAVLPLLRRAHGRIIFVGSIGGKIAVPLAGAYNASKYAMEAVADSRRDCRVADQARGDGHSDLGEGGGARRPPARRPRAGDGPLSGAAALLPAHAALPGQERLVAE